MFFLLSVVLSSPLLSNVHSLPLKVLHQQFARLSTMPDFIMSLATSQVHIEIRTFWSLISSIVPTPNIFTPSCFIIPSGITYLLFLANLRFFSEIGDFWFLLSNEECETSKLFPNSASTFSWVSELLLSLVSSQDLLLREGIFWSS